MPGWWDSVGPAQGRGQQSELQRETRVLPPLCLQPAERPQCELASGSLSFSPGPCLCDAHHSSCYSCLVSIACRAQVPEMGRLVRPQTAFLRADEAQAWRGEATCSWPRLLQPIKSHHDLIVRASKPESTSWGHNCGCSPQEPCPKATLATPKSCGDGDHSCRPAPPCLPSGPAHG